MNQVKTWAILWNEFKSFQSNIINPQKWVYLEESKLLDKEYHRFYSKSPEEEQQEKEQQNPLPPLKDIEDLGKPDPKPEEPEYPTPDECCGSGCRVCVYDLYEQNLEKYEVQLREWKLRQADKQKKKENEIQQDKEIEDDGVNIESSSVIR